MIAEVYEKCDRDYTVTITRCYDYVQQVKMNKKMKKEGGSAFSPVDLEDGPVARKLDFDVHFHF